MLQQTQVATVINYFNRFIKRFPTVKKLAAADQAEVLKLWEGLGYYRRARQMHSAAQLIVEQHGGNFPNTFDEVLALPGIGKYTAGAILSISLDQRLPILEGNTIRVFARLTEMPTDPKTSVNQKILWGFSESLLPRKRCGDFNQSLMELGSEICHPKNPKCLFCPIRSLCPTAVKGLQQEIPAPSKKIIYEDLHEAVLVVKRGNKFLVRQCAPKERWEGLWDFPRFPNPAEGSTAGLTKLLTRQTGIKATLLTTKIAIKHAVTKFRITLSCYVAQDVSGRIKKSESPIKWMTDAEIRDTPMSVTGRKIAEMLSDLA